MKIQMANTNKDLLHHNKKQPFHFIETHDLPAVVNPLPNEVRIPFVENTECIHNSNSPCDGYL